MAFANPSFWKKIPAFRLLLPFIAGVGIQLYLQLPDRVYTLLAIVGFTLVVYSLFLPFFARYRSTFLTGISLYLMFTSLGALAISRADPRKNKQWLGNFYKGNGFAILRLTEPLQEKKRSFKSSAQLLAISENNSLIAVEGGVIVYFRKDSALQQPEPGAIIVTNAQLQQAPAAMNPGAFDYSKYLLSAGITHQVYLEAGTWVTLQQEQRRMQRFIFNARQYIVSIIRKYIRGEKEKGLAEALLIGYKEDLDKSLVQSYTNTGVVHVIAISGLHLGLIYWLLLQLSQPLLRWRHAKWLRLIIIIAGLWLFSLLAGAQPSILRSAVMFSCIIAGQTISRGSSVFNTLAISAFGLLCYNPFWIRDIGFQLSYTAVFSLLLFAQPVYHIFAFRNRILDLAWKMNAVTIAAQLLTTPLCLYHFHQFPNYFLVTNFVAVPLSSAILFGEIVLCSIALFPAISMAAGAVLTFMIRFMNGFVEWVESLPFAVWTGFHISAIQALLLTMFIACMMFAITERSKRLIQIALLSLMAFTLLRVHSFINANRQQKIIVYQVSGHTAVDFISGREFFFKRDSSLDSNKTLVNFHLQPSRILHRLKTGQIQSLHQSGGMIQFGPKRILFAETLPAFFEAKEACAVDLLIVSGNPRAQPALTMKCFPAQQVVIDGSVAAWRAQRWQTVCDSLKIPCHPTAAKRAFVMSIR